MFFRLRRFHDCACLAAAVVLCWLSAAPARAAGSPREEAPVFSVKGGVFKTNVLLSISPPKPGGVVRFTRDGTVPGPDSQRCEGPLVLTNSCVVRARAFDADGQPGELGAETYTLMDPELAGFTSNLPLVILSTHGTRVTHLAKVPAGIHIQAAGEGRAALAALPELSGQCLFNVRGQSSLRYLKRSFTLKMVDGAGDPRSVPVLGLPADPDWVLYAPFPDKTLMRDVLAYEMSRQMGHWAPRGFFVEVFISESGGPLRREDYAGVYVLEERVKRSQDRVDIAKLKPGDNEEPRVSGGYIFKKDHGGTPNMPAGGPDLMGTPQFSPSSGSRAGYPTGPGGFPANPRGFLPAARSGRTSSTSRSTSSRPATLITNVLGRPQKPALAGPGRPRVVSEEEEDYEDERELERQSRWRSSRTNEFWFVEPEPDEITPAQKAWLLRHVNQAEAAIYGPDFRDPARGYRAFLDVDSFIDYHLLAEATKNVDAFRFSTFFHKDRGGKIKAQPVWDWNLSFGNNRGKQGYMPEYWLWPQLDDREYSWYRRLFEDPDFGQRYVDRWTALRGTVFASSNVLGRIDALAAFLDEAQKRNFEKWPILGRPVNPSYFTGATYAEEVEWMKKYIRTRLDWIDLQFPPVPRLAQASPGRAELTALVGEIYYTVDGTDPRAPGGAVAESARRYEQAIALANGAPLFARVRQEGRWSGPLVAGGAR